MKHRKSKIKLNRNSSHRKALFRNLVKNLFIHESIKTTLIKAKATRSLAERVISLAKEDTVVNKRRVYSIIGNHKLTARIFNEIGSRFKNRPGGYTQIVPLGNRKGDGAQMAILSLVELKAKIKPKSKKKKTKEQKEPVKGEKPKKKEKKPVPEEKKKDGFLKNLRKYLGKDKSSQM
jgi:large subunit ribosomal protein L17